MNISGHFLFLGTGASMGIPVIGCGCSVCHSANHFNRRLRPSGLLKIQMQNILIDCGPDFRLQALKYYINTIDGLILTHSHYDHIGGMDDLRAFFIESRAPIQCLLSQETADETKKFFYYLFDESSTKKLVPTLVMQVLKGERGVARFLDLPIQYVTYEQAGMHVNGFRIGNLAYISDIRAYPNSIFEDLRGVENLIIGALRFTPTKLHFSVDEAIEFSQKIQPQQTWITHISHDLDHEKTKAYLPSNIQLAYDGLELDVEITRGE